MLMTRPEQSCKTIKKVVVGMSGGVDSSVASLLLQQQGFDVTGLTLVTHDGAQAAIDDAAAICRHLGIEHIVADVRRIFQERVIDDFVDAWVNGLTPNPCVRCNPSVKFSILQEQAGRLGGLMATGHYAAVEKIEQTGRLALTMTDSGQKDQTYFLYRLSQEQLSRLIFPLRHLKKDDVRSLAAAAGLAGGDRQALADKPDSQDICFINDRNYIRLIRDEVERRGMTDAARLLKEGPILDMDGREIGRHSGLLAYTIGQRKGFDVRTTERLFVIKKDAARNALVVGPYTAVLQETIMVSDVVYSGLASFQPGQACLARVRSSAQPVACRVFPQTDDRLAVHFSKPVAAPAAGQSCVFYANGIILAGGLID